MIRQFSFGNYRRRANGLLRIRRRRAHRHRHEFLHDLRVLGIDEPHAIMPRGFLERLGPRATPVKSRRASARDPRDRRSGMADR